MGYGNFGEGDDAPAGPVTSVVNILAPLSTFPLDSPISQWLYVKPITTGLSITNAERSRRALQNACRSDPPGDLRAIVPRRRADGRGPDRSGRGLATGRLKASRRSEAGRAGARSP